MTNIFIKLCRLLSIGYSTAGYTKANIFQLHIVFSRKATCTVLSFNIKQFIKGIAIILPYYSFLHLSCPIHASPPKVQPSKQITELWCFGWYIVLFLYIHRGQVRLVQGGVPASVHLIQSLSDSDDDNDSAWEGCLGDRYNPPGKWLLLNT